MKSLMWRMGEECGVLYTEDRRLLEQVMELQRGPAGREATATTYTNARGRVFAWQVTFALSQWNRIVRALGKEKVEIVHEVPSRPSPPSAAAPRARKRTAPATDRPRAGRTRNVAAGKTAVPPAPSACAKAGPGRHSNPATPPADPVAVPRRLMKASLPAPTRPAGRGR